MDLFYTELLEYSEIIICEAAMNFFRFDRNRVVGMILTLSVFLIIYILYSGTTLFDIVERGALDFRFFLRDPGEKSVKVDEGIRRTRVNPRVREDIIILGIDEDTIRDFSDNGIQWPFPWDIHTKFINFVNSGNPSAIFFDITFLDHKKGERELAKAISDSGKVFIDYPFENIEADTKYQDIDQRIELLKRVRFKASQDADYPDMVEEAVPPTPELMKAARGVGFANVFPDPFDNINRQMPLVMKFKGHYYPNVDLLIAMHHFEVEIEDVEVVPGKHILLKNANPERIVRPDGTNTVTIPIDKRGFMDINYVGGAGSFRSYPYGYYVNYGTMQGNTSLENRIVLVAAYSVTGIATDLHKSPYGTTFGIEHHANALNTILNQDFLRKLSDRSNILIMFFIALILGFLLTRITIIKGTLFSFFLILSYLGVSFYLFDSKSVVIAMFTPPVQMVFSFIFIITYRVLTEQKEKRYIRQTFSKFVSKSVVDELLKYPEKLKLGGEKKILTVLFSDIRGFTTLSEKLTPEELVEHLNQYLQAMTDLVFKYNGTLDKYVGDEIMAFWGAPVELENHALEACKSALEQIEVLKMMNESWKSMGKPGLEIGIGINSGDMVVGNMGSSSRMDYTLMGDNVNLGARLEGTNKIYGTSIIISEATYLLVKDHVVVRELDLIRVKGKEHPVVIYELIELK